MKELSFSVIIPAHNEEKVIDKCLKSVLNQTKEVDEIIFVDDNSTDNTYDIVRSISENNSSLKMLQLKEDKGGSAAAARNRGSEIANGEYIIFIDADQIAEKYFIEKIYDFIKDKRPDATDFHVYSYRPSTIFQKAWSAYRIDKSSLNMPHVIKKEIFKDLKYNEEIFYYEDGEIQERFLKKGYEYKGPAPAKIYHIDTENLQDFKRQRKWQGIGISRLLKKQGDWRKLRYFIPCILLPIIIFSWIPILVYWSLIWLKFTSSTKKPFESFLWVIIDFFGRFISLFYFTLDLIFG